MTATALRDEVQKVASMVGTARRLLATGTMVDLSALEGKVAGLCAAVDGLPRDEGRTLVPSLDALMGSLDRLAADLEAHHQSFQQGKR